MLLDGSFFFAVSFFLFLFGCLAVCLSSNFTRWFRFVGWLVQGLKLKGKKKNNLQPSTSKNCIANFQYPLPVNNYCSINTDLSSCSDVSIESQLLKCTRMLMLYHVTGV